MKNKFLSVTIVIAVLLTVCASASGTTSTPADSAQPAASAEIDSELMALFEKYVVDENQETGDKIMRYFKANTEVFLNTYAEYGGHELLLLLIGSRIAEANREGDTTYQQILDEAENLKLSSEAARQLKFIKANVEYWQNH